MSYCRACGRPLAADTAACGSCGTSVLDDQGMPPPLPVIESSTPTQLFIGKKYAYYQQKWARADSGNRVAT